MARKGLAGILLLSPLALGASTITFGPIGVSKVVGDPLIAERSQSLTFTINHQGGDQRNIFDFVFTVSESTTELFKVKKSFFKVPNGLYEVALTIPAKVLQKEVALRFKYSCERTYALGGYVCYSFKEITKTPKEAGRIFSSKANNASYGFESVYYPSVEFYQDAFYSFYGVQKKRRSNSRRLHLDEITFTCNYMSEDYSPVKRAIGELRIFTNISYWKIGEMVNFSYVSLPLTYKEDSNGTYSLQLSNFYSFSKETGEMMSATLGYPRTRDLILPYWATASNPLRIAVSLCDFNQAGETYVFEKEAYYQGDGALGGYTVHWEES